jgi:hypothetical protein
LLPLQDPSSAAYSRWPEQRLLAASQPERSGYGSALSSGPSFLQPVRTQAAEVFRVMLALQFHIDSVCWLANVRQGALIATWSSDTRPR